MPARIWPSGVSTEPSRLYHGVAVIVAGLHRGLSLSYAQPQLVGGADVVAVDGLRPSPPQRQGLERRGGGPP